MADFDFLDGFDADGDWGFTSVKEKPSEEQSKQTETVVKQTADSTAKAVSSDIVNRLDSKLDKVLSLINSTKSAVNEKNQTEFLRVKYRLVTFLIFFRIKETSLVPCLLSYNRILFY